MSSLRTMATTITKVAGSAITRTPVSAAAPSVSSVRLANFAPVSNFFGRNVRTVGVKHNASIHSARAVQVRASTAQEEKVTTGSDIIDKVKSDHAELQSYFDNYKKAHKSGDDAEARKWFNQFVWEISRHSVSEELVLYPMLAGLGQRGQELADKSREDHHKVKEILADLQKTIDMEEFDKKMDEMMSDLKEHIKMEENEDLTYLKENTEESQRETAGSTFALGKSIAPTQPHPGVPEKLWVLEAAVGLLAAPVDKFRDIFYPFPSDPKKNLN